MGRHNGPYLPAIGPYTQDVYAAAGLEVDRKTGKVYMGKADGGVGTYNLKEGIRKMLTLSDRQDYCNRFTWTNVPCGYSGQTIENMLYYRGKLCFFYEKTLNKFFFLPFAPVGPFDVKGRPAFVKPLPFNGTTETKDNKKTPISNWLDGKVLRVIYDPILPEDLVKDPSFMTDACVILTDHTPGLSQYVIPRSELSRDFIDMESDCLPFMRTALLNATGIKGMRVNSDSEQAAVEAASASINEAALTGRKYVGIVGSLEFQELTGDSTGKAEEFLLALQSLENFRLSTLGVDNGGLFQKKTSITDQQNRINGGAPSMALDDCTASRQNFCDIANSIWWYLDLMVMPSETAKSLDYDGNGEIGVEEDMDGAPDNPATAGGSTEGGEGDD